MSREEIALQLTKAVISQISFRADNVKTLPYEIYNSIYNNLNSSKIYDDSDTPVIIS